MKPPSGKVGSGVASAKSAAPWEGELRVKPWTEADSQKLIAAVLRLGSKELGATDKAALERMLRRPDTL